jgi:hypothetical protein
MIAVLGAMLELVSSVDFVHDGYSSTTELVVGASSEAAEKNTSKDRQRSECFYMLHAAITKQSLRLASTKKRCNVMAR